MFLADFEYCPKIIMSYNKMKKKRVDGPSEYYQKKPFWYNLSFAVTFLHFPFYYTYIVFVVYT